MGSVPSKYMIGSMSFLQTALADIFQEEISDRKEAHQASIAWNKMLMVQLDILQAGYINETPTAATEEAPPIPESEQGPASTSK
jgi:hypothetical protein